MFSESKVVVRYAETDKMGIVHHSVYPIWYEFTRTEFSKNMGISYVSMEERGLMMPLVELSCKYIRPADYDDTLTVRAWISKLTPARIEFSYEIYKEGILINTGYTLHAWVGKHLKPTNCKKNFPDIYQKLQETM